MKEQQVQFEKEYTPYECRIHDGEEFRFICKDHR